LRLYQWFVNTNNSQLTSQSEIEETIQRIVGHVGVEAVIIASNDGKIIRTVLPKPKKQQTQQEMDLDAQHATQQYAQVALLMAQLASKSKSAIRDLDPTVRRLCLLTAVTHYCRMI